MLNKEILHKRLKNIAFVRKNKGHGREGFKYKKNTICVNDLIIAHKATVSSSPKTLKCLSLVKQILLRDVLRVDMIAENETHTRSGELLQTKCRGSIYSFPYFL